MSNREMLDRVGLPPIEWHTRQELIEHNAAAAIRLAIFKYMEEYYGPTL